MAEVAKVNMVEDTEEEVEEEEDMELEAEEKEEEDHRLPGEIPIPREDSNRKLPKPTNQ